MSWLFGKKKQKDSPVDSAEEEQPSSDHGEGFMFVEPRPNPFVGEGGPYPGSGLYPFIGGLPSYPTVLPSNSDKQNNQGEVVPYLHDVPFKLCKRLEANMNTDLEIDQLRISEILSFLERIGSQNYDYDFSIEESVIAEMNSRNGE